MPTIQQEKRSSNFLPGFGDYTLSKEHTFEQIQAANKLQKIAYAILFGILATSSLLLIPYSISLALLGFIGFSGFCISNILKALGIANQAPPLSDLFPAEVLAKIPQLGEVSDFPCSGFPTENGPDSYNWKQELIKAARHTIVLSGCYCADEVFDQTLELMEERMNLFPELKIYILSSDALITEENRANLKKINAMFPSRFTYFITPELFPMVSPITGNLSITSNHCKALIIDAGAYFMLGGTGITHSFSEEKGLSTPAVVDKELDFVENMMDSVMKLKAFRDMDFVFHSSINGVGTRLHVEMMKLVEGMRFRQDGEMISPETNWPEYCDPTSERFHNEEKLNGGIKVACYATGPEQEKNAFLEALIEQVDQAEESIVVDHLYFHPPERLLEALIRAVERGVKLTILMNKDWEKSPGSHRLYAHRSKYFVSRLFQGEPKKNIEVFQFAVPFTSLHKKLICIDQKYTFCGSANLGKKSLENLDYEINLRVESEAFAAQIAETVERDKRCCERVPAESCHEASLTTKLLSPLQALPMYIV